MNIIKSMYKTHGKVLTLSLASFLLFISIYVASVSFQDKGVHGQYATVALAQSSACFSDTEMSQIQTEKQNLESSLASENKKLDVVQENIDSVAEEVKSVTDEVEELRRVLITESNLNEIKENMDAVRKGLLDLDTLETSAVGGVCSAPGYFDKNSCENASGPIGGTCSAQWYTDEQSCVTAGYYEGGGCSASGYYDKASCENAGYSYSVITGNQTTGTCSGGSSYTDESSCVNAGYYEGGGCSDSSYNDVYSCTQAGSYQDGGYCSNPYYSNQQTCESENFSWIEGGTFVSAGHTWTDPSFVSYGYTWSQPWYEALTEVTVPYGYTWKEPQWVNAGYGWTYSGYASYGYIWKDATEVGTRENLVTSLENLSKEYEEKLNLRNTQMGSIQEKETTLSEVHARLKDLVENKIGIKEKIAKLDVELQGVESKSSKGVCQAYETSCSDGLDNDSDLAVDCSDSDCSLDSYCSNTSGTTTPPIGGTTPPTPVPAKPLFSSLFKGTYNTITSLTNNVLLVNSRDIVPAMKELKTLSSSTSTNPQVIFDKMATVKAIINSNNKTTADLRIALNQLRTENAKTEDAPLKVEAEKLVTAGLLFADSLSAYHTTLLKFLTGAVPTADLDTELNQRIADSTTKGTAYRAVITSTNTVLTAAVKKAEALELASTVVSGSLRASSITPKPGEIDIAVSLDKINVTFAKDVIAFNQATAVVTDSIGNSIKTVTAMGARNTFTVSLLDTLNPNEVYRVSVQAVFVEDVTNDLLSWSQTWSFATEKKDTGFIGGIIDFIDDLLGLGGNKKDAEAVCDDGKDNDDNGVADCSDKACEDDDYCKKAECGNNKMEKGEECDDGNTIDGDGCSSSCVTEQNNKTTCDDADGDGYDDDEPTIKCGCLDKDEDGKDDITGVSCGSGSGGVTCLLCQYEVDNYKGYEDRFKNACENTVADKKIIETNISGDEVSQCPKNTTNYKFVIESHSCAANAGRIAMTMKNSINEIFYNAINNLEGKEKEEFEKKEILITGDDKGCHSAGGEYFKNNAWYNHFEDLPSLISKRYRMNPVTVSITGNQTYGYGNNQRDVTTVGRVKLYSSITGWSHWTKDGYDPSVTEGKAGRVQTQLASCPSEGEWCLSPKEPPEVSTLSSIIDSITGREPVERYNIAEPILCGNINVKPERYFCATYPGAEKHYNPNGDHTGYDGKWKKDW